MKRIISLFIIFTMLFTVSFNIFAENEPEKTNVIIDGKSVEVAKINVMFNSEQIESDVPPILYNDRTLVPIRFIANYLNANIEWDGEKYEVKINTANKEILLKIDSDDVIINGEKKKLPYNVPAKLVNDRTMVPLRFVAEELGCEVEWDQETYTGLITYKEEEDIKEQEITNVYVKKDDIRLPKIVIETTNNQVSYKEILLEEPYRLVIDIDNSKFNIRNKDLIDARNVLNIDVETYPIKEIRGSQFSVDPNITRLVIELDEQVEHMIKPLEEGQGIEIGFINKVKKIELKEIKNREAIVIYNTEIPKYNIIRLSNPDRIVFDMLDSILEGDNTEYDYETGFIGSVRTSQFEPDALYKKDDKIVRLVMDIKDTKSKPHLTVKEDEDKIILYLDDEDIEKIDYKNEDDSSGTIKINAKRKTKYNVEYDEEKNILEVKIDKQNISLNDDTYAIKDGLVHSIIISEDKEYEKIEIKLEEKIEYTIDSDERDKDIQISFSKENKSKYSDKLIVIDAGHGGKDPGTITPTAKIYEKDLNLSVALKLNEKLKKLGFKTLLIRDSDEYVGLYERAEIANSSDGDIYISIHFNAHPDKNISGIQTFYCPAYESPLKTEDNFPLANALHQELLKELKAVDRGIIRKPEYVVVRETKMPAALVELGFVTNPEEEKKIITQEYHEMAAEALVKGIVKYFDEINSDKQ